MMKRLITMALLFTGPALFGAPASGQEVGAYFSLVNTYLFEKAPQDGRRHLVRARTAYAVEDLKLDSQDRVWYQVVFHNLMRKQKGVGWTPRAPHELLPTERKPVLVYSRILDGSNKPFTTMEVPVAGMELLNEIQSSKIYPQIDWQKIRYELELPVRGWVRGGAGVYRGGKTTAFITLVYGEMVTRNIEKEKLQRLLTGVVHIGDGVQDVRWALDQPLRTQEEKVGEVNRSTWEYPEMVILFENDIVKQLN